MKAIHTSFRNSVFTSNRILLMLAPIAFLIAISLVFCSAAKVDNPNKPRHEIKIPKKVKHRISFEDLFIISEMGSR